MSDLKKIKDEYLTKLNEKLNLSEASEVATAEGILRKQQEELKRLELWFVQYFQQ